MDNDFVYSPGKEIKGVIKNNNIWRPGAHYLQMFFGTLFNE